MERRGVAVLVLNVVCKAHALFSAPLSSRLCVSDVRARREIAQPRSEVSGGGVEVRHVFGSVAHASVIVGEAYTSRGDDLERAVQENSVALLPRHVKLRHEGSQNWKKPPPALIRAGLPQPETHGGWPAGRAAGVRRVSVDRRRRYANVSRAEALRLQPRRWQPAGRRVSWPLKKKKETETGA